MKVPNSPDGVNEIVVSLSRLQNEGSQRSEAPYSGVAKSIKATE